MLIYIVEDDKNIREIESYALKNIGYEVQAFEKAADFNVALAERLPELIVLDIMLPDIDGLDVLAQIRETKAFQAIPVIMVTAKDTELDKVIGLDHGADDYIAKPFGVMELISRVKALLRRSRPTERSVVTVGSVCLDEERHEVTVDGRSCDLTYKEYELLKLLMSKAGMVITRESIMEKVWGTDFEGESRTLDMHIKTLRQKLQEAGPIIKTVRNVGYIFNL